MVWQQHGGTSVRRRQGRSVSVLVGAKEAWATASQRHAPAERGPGHPWAGIPLQQRLHQLDIRHAFLAHTRAEAIPSPGTPAPPATRSPVPPGSRWRRRETRRSSKRMRVRGRRPVVHLAGAAQTIEPFRDRPWRGQQDRPDARRLRHGTARSSIASETGTRSTSSETGFVKSTEVSIRT